MPDTAPPTPLTTSFWTSNVRQQVIATVLSSDSPTATEGRVRWDTDTNRLRVYDGTGWIIINEPYQSWTPTWGGITIGSGTSTGWYQRCDGQCKFFARLDLSSTTMTGPLTLTPPINAASANYFDTVDARYTDSGTGWADGFGTGASVSSIALYAINPSTTYVNNVAISTTVPFTWANTDIVTVWGEYRMTTLYS